jgi:hypothetical protein
MNPAYSSYKSHAGSPHGLEMPLRERHFPADRARAGGVRCRTAPLAAHEDRADAERAHQRGHGAQRLPLRGRRVRHGERAADRDQPPTVSWRTR